MSQIDPITLSVLREAFVGIANDMSYLLRRSCHNLLISQLLDHHTGIYDRTGRLISSSYTLPSLSGTGGFQVRLVYQKYKDDLHPGDEFIMNCPYTAYGTHLPDWTFIRPIFHQGELAFFAFSKAHQLDTSGAHPGAYFPHAYDIHAEGLMIPPIKWTEKGKPISHVRDLILNNVRFREHEELDIRAMFASLKLGEERCIKLLERYGRETVFRYVDELIDVMYRTIKSEIATFPDGTYRAASATDEDGTHHDKPVWVRCELTIKKDDIFIDFTQSDPQTKFVSSPWANTHPRAVYAVLCTLDPSLALYHNEGSHMVPQIYAPPGTVVNSTYPTTVGSCPTSVGIEVIETVLECLGQAVPERVPSGWPRQLALTEVGTDRGGKRYYVTHFNAHGGAGASFGHDGWPHLGTISTLGALKKANVEMLESRYPWRILRYEMVKDSCGHGKWRGGHGVHIEWLSETEKEHSVFTGTSDGILTDVYAIAGGKGPGRNQMFLIKARSGERVELRAKRGPIIIEKGDKIIQISGGGGGWGDPTERDPEKVRWDVLNEYISPEAARDVYRLAVDPESKKIITAA